MFLLPKTGFKRSLLTPRNYVQNLPKNTQKFDKNDLLKLGSPLLNAKRRRENFYDLLGTFYDAKRRSTPLAVLC